MVMEYIGTSSQEELLLATTFGIGAKGIQKIKETEKYITDRSNAREKYMSNKEVELIFPEKEQKKVFETKEIINPLDECDKRAIVIAGGSYNKHNGKGNYEHSEVSREDEEILQNIADGLNPEEDMIIIGHTLEGQEGRLVELLNEKGKFDIFMIASLNPDHPLSSEVMQKVEQYGIQIVKSGQTSNLASYKKIEEDIFSQEREAKLFIFDGEQAAVNLIADANNGKNNQIYSKEHINEFVDNKLKAIPNVNILTANNLEENSTRGSNKLDKDQKQDANIETSLVAQNSNRWKTFLSNFSFSSIIDKIKDSNLFKKITNKSKNNETENKNTDIATEKMEAIKKDFDSRIVVSEEEQEKNRIEYEKHKQRTVSLSVSRGKQEGQEHE